jgi:putative ABC transport system ATP-binding protein
MSKGVGLARLEVENLSLDVPGRRLLAGVGITVEAGECVAILGASGVGKTSLLNCVAGISTPALGSVRIDGTVLSELPSARRADFRLGHIGIVFQFGELLPELSLAENVALPLRLRGLPRRETETRTRHELDRLGLGGQAASHPDSLSGGEIQRAGIARALVHRPLLVLADEPNGMLDEENTQRVASLLGRVAREWGVAVLVVTHDPVVASAADRVLKIRDRQLIPAGNVESAESGP